MNKIIEKAERKLEEKNHLRSAYAGIMDRLAKGYKVTFRENGIKKFSIYAYARRRGIKVSMRRLDSNDKKIITIERVK